jgi:hypothetical protein
MGNDMLTSQISLSDKSSLELTNQEAVKNHLSIIDLGKCIETLKQYYNTTDDFTISKTQYSSLLKINTNETISDSTSLKIYNINTRNEINTSLCNNTNITYKIPISENMKKEMNLTAFQILNNSNIDVFNPNSSSFTSVCSTHIDNATQYDTTLNYRRQNYFQNKSIQCSGTDCKYEGIDENYYVNCNCKQGDQISNPEVFDTVVDYYLQPLSQWNFNLILCYQLVFIPGIISNIGLYVMIVLLSINTLILLALQLFIKVNIDADINKVIYYDCLFYDKKVMLIEDYFNREKEKQEHNKVKKYNNKDFVKTPFSSDRNINKENNNDILNLNIKPDNIDHKKEEDDDDDDVVVVQHNNFIEGISHNDKSFNQNYGNRNRQEANDKNENVVYNSPITIHDYEELGAMDVIEYDKRKFTKYLADELVMNHSIISLFFKKSLFDPFYIRLMKLIFQISLQFCTNALLFTDDYIDARALNTQKVYLDYNLV